MPKLDKYADLFWAKKEPKKNWLANPDNAKLYHSTRWRRLRAMLLARHPICQTEGCTQPSKFCDHINPYQKGMDFYDESNLQMLCVSCNASKTGKQATNK